MSKPLLVATFAAWLLVVAAAAFSDVWLAVALPATVAVIGWWIGWSLRVMREEPRDGLDPLARAAADERDAEA